MARVAGAVHLIRVGLLAWALLTAHAYAQPAEPWRDPSPHQTQFVQVDDEVLLEVLDWGGSGRPIVLLAGLGHTAHVYDAIAPKLALDYRVFGITRRGFGSSSKPDSGYSEDRLARDLLEALKSLELAGVVLIGHSIAGQELSAIGAQGIERVSALIYLDAAADDLRGIREEPKIQEFTRKLPRAPAWPSDPRQFRALYGFDMPEAELRNAANKAEAWSAILAGVTKPDYSRIQIPALAIYAAPQSATDVPPWLQTDDPEQLAVLQESFEYGVARRERAIAAFRRSRSPKVVLLEGAHHYVFLSNEAEVLREVRAFLTELPVTH